MLQLRDIEPEDGHAEREPNNEVLSAFAEAKRVLENSELPGAEGHEVRELPGGKMTGGQFGVVPLWRGKGGGAIHDDQVTEVDG